MADDETLDDLKIEFDQVLVQYIGEFGQAQKRQCILLVLYWLIASSTTTSVVFMTASPDHGCATPPLNKTYPTPENMTHDQYLAEVFIPKTHDPKTGHQVGDKCHIFAYNTSHYNLSYFLQQDWNKTRTQVDCKGWYYDKSIFKNSLVTKFDLVCQRKVWVTTAKSVYMVGSLVGCLISGSLADRFGRRPALLLFCVFILAGNIGLIFLQHLLTYMVLRFCVGVSIIGALNVAFVLIVETVGPSWRMFAGVLRSYFWAAGMIITGVLAYFIREWIVLQAALTSMGLGMLFYIWLIPESSRWLFAVQRHSEGMKKLQDMARQNGKNLPANLIVTVKKPEKANITDLFRFRILRKRTAILAYIWCVMSMVYYGLTLNPSKFASSLHINFIIGATVELPIPLVCQQAARFVGRRIIIAAGAILCGVALLAVTPLPEDVPDSVTTALTITGRFGVSLTFPVLYVYTSELYPTNMRTIGLSSCSSFARIGAIVAPFIYDLGDIVGMEHTGLIIFGVLSILAGLLIFLLPETRKTNLPESVYDMKDDNNKA